MMAPAQANAWATRTGYIPVSRAGIAAAHGERLLPRSPERPHRARPARLRRALALVARSLPHRARGRAAPPRGGRARRQRDARAVLDEARRVALEPMKPRRALHPYLMLAPTALVLGLFFLYPLALAVQHSFYAWDLLTPPVYVGARNYRSLVAGGELARHRGPHARLQRRRRLALGHARPRAGASRSTARAASTPSSAARVFSAYVVSWVAVALLWMWILDADGGPAQRRCSARSHLPTPELARRSRRRRSSRSRSSACGRSRATRWSSSSPASRTSPARSSRRRRSTAPAPGRASSTSPGRSSAPARRSSATTSSDPLVPGLRRGARDDAGRPGRGDHHLRLRHLRARLRQPPRGPRQRAHRGLLRPAPRAHRPPALGLPARPPGAPR